MKKHSIIWAAFILSIAAITLQACKKDEPAEGIDLELFNMAEETAGFTWFKNSDAWLPKSSGSGHNYTGLRTRYNTIASTQLDTDGKILANASFPEGSLVVKELSNGSSSERYAILYKRSDNEHADANGWVWGCTGCHLQQDNIDYMLMNKFFP